MCVCVFLSFFSVSQEEYSTILYHLPPNCSAQKTESFAASCLPITTLSLISFIEYDSPLLWFCFILKIF